MKKIGVIYIIALIGFIVGIVLVSSGRFDLNNDGVVNIADLQLIASHFQGKTAYNSSYDLNNDSKIDLFDVVSVAKHIGTSTPNMSNSSAFYAPNLLNASFETGWDGFYDGGASTPVGVTRTTNQSQSGNYSVEYDWTANTNDGGAAFISPQLNGGNGEDRVWVRFYFYLEPNWSITTIQKFLIFWSPSYVDQLGGLELNNDGWSFSFYCEAGAVGSYFLPKQSVTTGVWHSMEIDYWRNGDTSFNGTDLPSVAIWYDGKQISKPNGPDPAFGGTYLYWLNGRLYPQGSRGCSTKMSHFFMVGTRNGGNTGNGTLYLDNISASSLGEIAP